MSPLQKPPNFGWIKYMDKKNTRSRFDPVIAVGLGMLLLVVSYLRVLGDTG